MCGICGTVRLTGASGGDPETCTRMLRLIQHRGPETSIVRNVGEGVLFGHNRLSIIDLAERSNQPFTDAEDRYHLTYNGEIYNYAELKSTHLRGTSFRTRSDTEVILELYKSQDAAAFEKLDGMFAFALYDSVKGRVYLVRDRMGKKPLYYTVLDGCFYFSSELKSFSAVPRFAPRLDQEVLNYCLLFYFSPSLSPLQEVHMVDPGHFLEIDLCNGRFASRRYFDVLDTIDPVLNRRLEESREADVIEEFEALLVRAVRKRLVADVPVSSINSGGLDSSLVSAIALRENHDVELFHVSVDNDPETEFARELSEALGRELNIEYFDRGRYADHFHHAARMYEYYLVHPNSVALLALAARIHASGYKVVLGGEAADEVFGGYQHTQQLYRTYRRQSMLSRMFRGKVRNLLLRYKKYVDSPLIPGMANRLYDHVNSDPRLAREIGFIQELEHRFAHLATAGERKYRAFLMHDMLRYLAPLFLRGDKMFMGHSVELRLPFADVDLIRFSINLPQHYVTNKYILKRVAEKYLPRRIVHRRKMGFPVKYDIDCDIQHPEWRNWTHLNVRNRQLLYGFDVFLRSYFDGAEASSRDTIATVAAAPDPSGAVELAPPVSRLG